MPSVPVEFFQAPFDPSAETIADFSPATFAFPALRVTDTKDARLGIYEDIDLPPNNPYSVEYLRHRIIQELMAGRLILTTSRSKPRPLPRDWAGAFVDEVLGVIFDQLIDDVATISALRLTCRTFERAAWPAFAKYFNNHIFHLTDSSLLVLRSLAANKAAVPYLKQLKISTVKLLKVGPRSTSATYRDEREEWTRFIVFERLRFPNNPAQMQWIKEIQERRRLARALKMALRSLGELRRIVVVDDDQIPSLPGPTDFELSQMDFIRPGHTAITGSAHQLLPLSVRRWLTLTRSQTSNSVSDTYIYDHEDMLSTMLTRMRANVTGWGEALEESARQGWLFERKAHRRALEIIYKAVQQKPDQIDAAFLPRLRELKTQGRVSVASLFGCASRKPEVSCCPRLPNITHLSLSLTTWHPKHSFEDMNKQLRYYIPDFLATMPNLTHLTLGFLPTPYTPSASELQICTSLALGHHEPFSDTTTLPTFHSLTNLHLRNLNLDSPRALQTFLLAHSRTLTSLTNTNLKMTTYHWPTFIRFTGQNLKLEEYITINEATSQREMQAEQRRQDRIPNEWRPTNEEMNAVSRGGMTFVERVVDGDGAGESVISNEERDWWTGSSLLESSILG